MFLLFSFAGGGLERLIYTIHPNPPLSALRFFSLLRFGKTKLLFCSHLNRNVDKEGLWQGDALHCFAIAIVASKSCKNRLEISIWCPTTTDNFGCPFSVCMPITRLQGVLGLNGLNGQNRGHMTKGQDKNNLLSEWC